MKSENVVQTVQKSDDQKSSKEERVRGQTAEGLQEQRVKVDKSRFFFKKWPLSDWTFTWSCEKILVKENKLLNSCFYNELQDNGARLVEELRKIKIYPHPIMSVKCRNRVMGRLTAYRVV